MEEAAKRPPVKMSVAVAHDEDVLLAVKAAVELGIVEPVLIGNQERITEITRVIDLKLEKLEILHADTEEEAVFMAAKLADTGQVQVIMKGLVNSSPFLRGVLHKELNLKTGRVISHMSAFEIPHTDSLVFMTDGGINIAPSFEQKRQLIINAIEFLHCIGMKEPKVAILSANELVTDKMPVTVEAKKLAEVIQDQYKNNLIIEGPLPLDLAISFESLSHKGIESKLNGQADLLIVPTIEAGNILGKAITYYAKGTMAGIVHGAKVPLVLNSRSDSSKAKLASIALAVVATETATVGV